MAPRTAITLAVCCLLATPAAAQDKDLSWFLFDRGQKTTEQPTRKQIANQLDAALTRAAMPKGPQRLLPPTEYDRAYKGELSVTYVESQKEIMRLCPKTGYALKLGCAYMTDPQAADGSYAKCRVILANDGVVRASGILPETVYRHEIAHCNGWSADHAGARNAD